MEEEKEETINVIMQLKTSISVTKKFAERLPNSREKASIITRLDEARHWLRDLEEKEDVL